MIEITEKLLAEAAGWQVMKEARAIHAAGRVREVEWTPPRFRALVREGSTDYRAGLSVKSRTDIENLCTCTDARYRAIICAHSVAAGLELIKPKPAPAPPAPPPKPAAPVGPRFSVSDGEPLALHIIIPPPVAAMLGKGRVTVGIEAQVAGRRVLVSALDAKAAYRCDAGDLRALERLRAICDGELPGMANLSAAQFLEWLGALGDHPRITLGRDRPASVRAAAARPLLRISSGGIGAPADEVVPPAPRRENAATTLSAELPVAGALLAAGNHVWVLRDAEFVPVAPGLPAAYHAIFAAPISLPAEAVAGFAASELPMLRQFFDIAGELDAPAPTARPAATQAPTETVAFHLALEGSLNWLEAQLEARSGERRTTITSPRYQPTPVEAAALERLRAAGFTGPEARGVFVLKGEQKILAFFARELPRMQRDWVVKIGERFEHVTSGIERLEPKMEIRSSGEQWFDLSFTLSTAGGERFAAADLRRMLESGQSVAKLRNGQRAVFDPELLEEFDAVLRDCNPQAQQPGTFRMARQHAGYLEAVASEHGCAVAAPPAWRDWAAAQRQLERLAPVPLGPLETVLRPYQKLGVYWLHFLAQNGLGGILADEMGLGKTLQALSFLRTLSGGPALIVCPSSLVTNWAREAAKFTPEARVVVLEGGARAAKFADIPGADLVITSYALLRRDAEQYRGREFSAAILDEAHHIKNPDSQNAQAAFALRARHRFALTGTPLENSPRDLWAIMNFAMPGYLGTRRDFKDRYEVPAGAEPNGAEQARLVKRLRPFLLRRLKQTVAPELPEKLQQVVLCDLADEQRALYDGLLSETRRQSSELAGAKDQKKARMLVLTALMRLRQACCDQRLILPEATETGGKLQLLEELLEDAQDGGHRVLVFSQFVSMLTLLRERLDELGTAYCYLDGSTRNRQAEVDRFQTGSVPVFLISLKAGGVGLNLTAADTVVHFDPWWNPAVEDQATDRAHRIGQQNVVTAYKLIARDTIEEKILRLQQKKRAMAAAVVESEAPMMEGLSMDDIAELLE